MNQRIFAAESGVRAATGLVAALFIGHAAAQHAHEHGQDGAVATDCAAAAAPSVRCSSAPTVAFDAAGRLWAAFELGDRVWLTFSDDLGATFAAATAVDAEREPVDVNGENRPKVALGKRGEVYVSWTRKVAGGYNGEIRFARSADGGRTFEPVRTVNDDGLVTGHRFETLFVDSRGRVYLSWLDKRDLVHAEGRGEDYPGAAVYYTVSTDGGKTFAPNRLVAPNSCECCRIAAAETPQGDVALLFREVFDEHIRDHGFAVVGAKGVVTPLTRATEDDWRIDACPHHGPAMIGAGAGRYDIAWFTAGERGKGIFYGRFDPASGVVREPFNVSANPTAGHPSLASAGGRLLLAWKEFDGERTQVYVIASRDGGASWSERAVAAATSGASDHPFLVTRGEAAFLSWHTADEGLRVLPLAAVDGGVQP